MREEKRDCQEMEEGYEREKWEKGGMMFKDRKDVRGDGGRRWEVEEVHGREERR